MRRCVLGLVVFVGAVTACRMHPADDKTAEAIGEMRTLTRALGEYRSDCVGYPGALDRLLAVDGQAKGCHSYGAIGTSEHLGALRREPTARVEYEWSYHVVRPVAGHIPVVYEHFEMTATWPGPDKRYSFWTNDAGQIRFARGRAATKTDEVLY